MNVKRYVCLLLLGFCLLSSRAENFIFDAPADSLSHAFPVICGQAVVFQHGQPYCEELDWVQAGPMKRGGTFSFTFAGHQAYMAYQRQLDLDRGLASVTYRVGKVRFKRELFADFEGRRIVMRLTASRRHSISFETHGPADGASLLQIRNEGGELTRGKVTNADAVTIVLNLNGTDSTKRDENFLYGQWMHNHLKAYEKEFGKTTFKLFANKENKRSMLRFRFSRYRNVSSYLSTGDSSFLSPQREAKFVRVDDKRINFSTEINSGYSNLCVPNLVDASHGLIELLPALPDAWARKGELVGVEAPGGFTIELAWKNGRIKTLVVRSRLGGNCRIRVHSDIQGCKCIGMQPAGGENENPYYKGAGTQKVTPEKIPIQPTYTYDFDAGPRQVYVFTGK